MNTIGVRNTSLRVFYGEVKPNLGDRQKVVYDEIAKHDSITNSELAISLNMTINRITPRCKELRDKNLVIEDVERKCRVTGRNVKAWRIVRSTLF